MRACEERSDDAKHLYFESLLPLTPPPYFARHSLKCWKMKTPRFHVVFKVNPLVLRGKEGSR